MELLIKAYITNKEVTDFKQIFTCSPDEAYMNTYIIITYYTSCFAAQFIQWIYNVQKSIPKKYHHPGLLRVVVETGDFKHLTKVDLSSINYLLNYFTPISLWSSLDLTLEAAMVFYKIIPDDVFFTRKGCLEEVIKNPKFEYTMYLDSYLSTDQLKSLAISLRESEKKLNFVGPNYVGIVPLIDVVKTVDFEKTVFCSRTEHYKPDINWTQLEALGSSFINNDIGPYFINKTIGVYLPTSSNIELGDNQIDFGGCEIHLFESLYKKYGYKIVEQFVNYNELFFLSWFESTFKKQTSNIPSITKFQKPNICPSLYHSIYGIEPDWPNKCHRNICKECDPAEWERNEERTKLNFEQQERMYNW